MIVNDWSRMTYGAICLSAALKPDFWDLFSRLRLSHKCFLWIANTHCFIHVHLHMCGLCVSERHMPKEYSKHLFHLALCCDCGEPVVLDRWWYKNESHLLTIYFTNRQILWTDPNAYKNWNCFLKLFYMFYIDYIKCISYIHSLPRLQLFLLIGTKIIPRNLVYRIKV